MDKGFKIRMLRERQGLSQKQVALDLGINQSTYSKMEACEERISIENCKKIAKVIGVSISDIIEFEDKYRFVEKSEESEKKQLSEQISVLIKEIEELRRDNRILLRLIKNS